jgi:RimJ/RimL family protein N-acetyltransferase
VSSFPLGSRLREQTGPGRAERSPREDSAADNLPWISLRPLTLDDAGALLDGTSGPSAGLRWHEEYPLAETLDALQLVVAAHRAEGWSGRSLPDWWMYQIVCDDLVVGDAGFHGPPAVDAQPEVEIGYDVVPGIRGRGVATTACRLLLVLAWAQGAAVVRAETDPDNVASQRVLLNAGFTPAGSDRYAHRRPVPVSMGAA